MKKVKSVLFPALILGIVLFALLGCQKEEIIHAGLNAELLQINSEHNRIQVRDINGERSLFGENCALDCSDALKKSRVFYVNYKTGEFIELSLSDLLPVDHLILWISETELEKLTEGETPSLYEIQLGTQRL